MKRKCKQSCAFIIAMSVMMSAAAYEDGPYGSGGWRYKFKASDLEIMNDRAHFDGTWIQVPREPWYYGRCVIKAPDIPIFHDDGKADVFIQVSSQWVGFIDLNAESDVELFRVRAYTPSDQYAKFEYMHTGLMKKTIDYYSEEGIPHYYARTMGTYTLPMMQIDVRQGEVLGVEICRIAAGGTNTIKSIQVHTYPTE